MKSIAALLLLVLQLLFAPPPAFSYLIVECKGDYTHSFAMFSVSSKPYANLDDGRVTGYLYYHNVTCQSLTIPPPDATLSGDSILLLSDYSQCITERIVLAKAAGYNAILTYTRNDANTTITQPVVDTGIPLGIIQYSTVDTFMTRVVVSASGNTTVSMYGFANAEIVAAITFVFLITFGLLVVFGVAVFIVHHFCTRSSRRYRQLHNQRRNRRAEHIENILHHLQQLEQDAGTRAPLGSDVIEKFPTRDYTAEEQHDTCSVCVDEFQVGETVRELPCQHIFHPGCVDEWLSQHSSLCPLCKTNLRDTELSTVHNYGSC